MDLPPSGDAAKVRTMANKMRSKTLFLSLALCLSMLVMVAHGSANPVPAGGASGCVSWTKEARYEGLGYNHYVYLTSACKVVMECAVTTNVNPEPTTATVQPGGKATVLTFRGSPASEFTASVTCTKK